MKDEVTPHRDKIQWQKVQTREAVKEGGDGGGRIVMEYY